LSDNELKIFSVIVYNQSCTVAEMLDSLGENFGFYPCDSYCNKLLDNLVSKNAIKIDVFKNKEKTEKRKSYARNRRYLFLNDENIKMINIIEANKKAKTPYHFFINVKDYPEYKVCA
jgi:hypothetical protein